MSLISPIKSAIYAHGSEYYEASDIWDQSVTGGGSVPAWSGDYEYAGFLNIAGGWIIQRHQISTGQYRYVQGANTFPVNFALAIAGSLTGWDYYNTLFVTNP